MQVHLFEAGYGIVPPTSLFLIPVPWVSRYPPSKARIPDTPVYGIATDYCLKATALDAVNAGYKGTVIENLCRGVAPGTTANSLKEMAEKGVTIKKDGDF